MTTRTGRLEEAATLLGHLDAHGIRHGMLIEQRRQAERVVADAPDRRV